MGGLTELDSAGRISSAQHDEEHAKVSARVVEALKERRRILVNGAAELLHANEITDENAAEFRLCLEEQRDQGQIDIAELKERLAEAETGVSTAEK